MVKTSRPRTSRRRFSVKKKVQFKRKGTLPVRFRQNRSTYNKNKSLGAALADFSESKLSAISPLTESAPVAIATGGLAYQHVSVLGVGVPTNWTNIQHSLAGVSFPVGTGNNGRIGNYIYLRRTFITLSLEMNQTVVNSALVPHVFRMIVFKSRRANNPAGITYNPTLSLFLKENGDPMGSGTGGINGQDLMLQPTNKRNWVILKDRKFTLQPPLISTDVAYQIDASSKYAMRKDIRISLPHQTKCFMDTNEPKDYDFRWGIAIYAHAIGRDYTADSWEVSYRGTTSAFDN